MRKKSLESLGEKNLFYYTGRPEFQYAILTKWISEASRLQEIDYLEYRNDAKSRQVEGK